MIILCIALFAAILGLCAGLVRARAALAIECRASREARREATEASERVRSANRRMLAELLVLAIPEDRRRVILQAGPYGNAKCLPSIDAYVAMIEAMLADAARDYPVCRLRERIALLQEGKADLWPVQPSPEAPADGADPDLNRI